MQILNDYIETSFATCPNQPPETTGRFTYIEKKHIHELSEKLCVLNVHFKNAQIRKYALLHMLKT